MIVKEGERASFGSIIFISNKALNGMEEMHYQMCLYQCKKSESSVNTSGTLRSYSHTYDSPHLLS